MITPSGGQDSRDCYSCSLPMRKHGTEQMAKESIDENRPWVFGMSGERITAAIKARSDNTVRYENRWYQ